MTGNNDPEQNKANSAILEWLRGNLKALHLGEGGWQDIAAILAIMGLLFGGIGVVQGWFVGINPPATSTVTPTLTTTPALTHTVSLSTPTLSEPEEVIADADTSYEQGLNRMKLEQYDEAIADFTKTIELDPDYAWAYYQRGRAYNVRERFRKAIADLDKFIEEVPEYAWAYYQRGIAYKGLTRYDEAIADFDTAIDLYPDQAPSYYHRGLAYRATGKRDKAIADLRKAIELSEDPEIDERAEEVLRQLGANE